MKNRLIEVLESLNYPVFLQGSVAPEFPDTFLTFWNDETEGKAFYDNKEFAIVWEFTVNVYSTDPALTDSILENAKCALSEAGFEVYGIGRDVPSGTPTHTGRSITVLKRKDEK